MKKSILLFVVLLGGAVAFGQKPVTSVKESNVRSDVKVDAKADKVSNISVVEYVESLDVTKKQKAEIERIQLQRDKELEEFRSGRTGGIKPVNESSINEKYESQMRDVLTKDQLERFNNLTDPNSPTFDPLPTNGKGAKEKKEGEMKK